jgi:SET domain-containing protein
MPLRYPDTLGTLIEIRDSELKGLGVFALHDIPAGTILLCEKPLVKLIDTGTRADPLDAAVNALSPLERASFHSLHAFSRNKYESLNRSIVYSNGYSISNDLATGVFETASRINHSCVPNSHYQWKESLGRMVFWNRFKLLEGEEVTVDYGHKKSYLAKIYGFECSCGGCTDGSDVTSVSGSEGVIKEEIVGIDAVLSETLDSEKLG